MRFITGYLRLLWGGTKIWVGMWALTLLAFITVIWTNGLSSWSGSRTYNGTIVALYQGCFAQLPGKPYDYLPCDNASIMAQASRAIISNARVVRIRVEGPQGAFEKAEQVEKVSLNAGAKVGDRVRIVIDAQGDMYTPLPPWAYGVLIAMTALLILIVIWSGFGRVWEMMARRHHNHLRDLT